MTDKPSSLPPPKAALVTGAGRRIGRALALALAETGWTVAIHYNRSEAEANETVAAMIGFRKPSAAMGMPIVL